MNAYQIFEVPAERGTRNCMTEEYIEKVLAYYDIPAKVVKHVLAPQIDVYHVDAADPAAVTQLKKPIAALNAVWHRHVATARSPIAHFAIVADAEKHTTVYTAECLMGVSAKSRGLIAVLGEDTAGETVTVDLCQMPHTLIAGAAGSGKSVCLNTILSSLVYLYPDPAKLQLVLIDPKRVELAPFAALPHLRVPVADTVTAAVRTLAGLCNYMDERYKNMARYGIKNATEAGWAPLVVVIDELADLMLTSRYEAEEHIIRLAQLGRAAGIHLMIATQRPTANVVTGLIKSNIPCKIAFQTASIRDSINILDHKGAETLTGKGDALLKLPDRVEETRFQCAYTSAGDVARLVQAVR